MSMENINHPKMEIIVFILLSFLGIICISYYQGHNDKELYKTVFIVLLLFDIIFSFLILVMSGADEVEHFVRAEITSNGVIFPEFKDIPFKYETFNQHGYFLTIQSTLDLIDDSKNTRDGGFD